MLPLRLPPGSLSGLTSTEQGPYLPPLTLLTSPPRPSPHSPRVLTLHVSGASPKSFFVWLWGSGFFLLRACMSPLVRRRPPPRTCLRSWTRSMDCNAVGSRSLALLKSQQVARHLRCQAHCPPQEGHSSPPLLFPSGVVTAAAIFPDESTYCSRTSCLTPCSASFDPRLINPPLPQQSEEQPHPGVQVQN